MNTIVIWDVIQILDAVIVGIILVYFLIILKLLEFLYVISVNIEVYMKEEWDLI